jgi:hypothetical protein
MDSKKAQERSYRVFLLLFLKANPIRSTLGVVVSIGEKDNNNYNNYNFSDEVSAVSSKGSNLGLRG